MIFARTGTEPVYGAKTELDACLRCLSVGGSVLNRYLPGYICSPFLSLILDIPMIGWFVALLVTRPIATVVIFFEDRAHRKRRILLDYMGDLPELIAARHSLYHDLSDVTDGQLKNGLVPPGMIAEEPNTVARPRPRYSGASGEHAGKRDYFEPTAALVKSVEWYTAALSAHKSQTEGLSAHYTHLVDQVIELEKRRPRRQARRHHAEFVYMWRPDGGARAKNLALLDRESNEYELAIERSHADILSFTPPSKPLWKMRSGCWGRDRAQTAAVMAEIMTTAYFVTMVLCVLNVAFLYRLPWTAAELWRNWRRRDKVLARALVEHGRDFLALLAAIVVYGTLYRSLPLTADMVVAVFEQKSANLARKACFRQFRSLLDGFKKLFEIPFTWSFYSGTILSCMYGWLVPIDLWTPWFNSVLPALLIWGVTTAFPFAFALKWAPDIAAGPGGSSEVNAYVIGFFGVLAGLLLLSLRQHRWGGGAEIHRISDHLGQHQRVLCVGSRVFPAECPCICGPRPVVVVCPVRGRRSHRVVWIWR